MSDAYAIEVTDEVVGIAVRQDGERSFRFHAALPQYYPLEGRIYSRPADIQLAATLLKRGKPPSVSAHAA